MSSILEQLGFNTESCTPGKKQPNRGTDLTFDGNGNVTLNIDADTANKIVALLGDRVDFGLSYGLKIAICKGDSRKLQNVTGGRRKLNLTSARDNLLSYFPSASDGHGKTVLLCAYIDDVEFDEEHGVVVFVPNSFRYKDGAGLHYGTASDLGIG